MAGNPLDVGVRTRAFETLAICGGALALAGTLPAEGRHLQSWSSPLNKAIGLGRFLFAFSLVVFGIDHFIVLNLVAGLVPTWIPGGLFWASFTAIGFIAAGVSIATKRMARWAATLIATMFCLWFLLLHAPRIATAPRSHDPNEWSSAFIALAMCGGSLIMARAVSNGSSRSDRMSR